ncbi:hypothetical protein R1flu_023983 [Riccia fluitans]|uniref:NAD(P)H oxidase (H(2)O(2)-forming) n=1 Tax=Riccia fluitans TaxID=41844 RepID=A0ABD1XTL3_9MARC
MERDPSVNGAGNAVAHSRSYGGQQSSGQSRRQLRDLLRMNSGELENVNAGMAERNAQDASSDHVVVELMVHGSTGEVSVQNISQPGSSIVDRLNVENMIDNRRELINSRGMAEKRNSTGSRVTPVSFSPEREDSEPPPSRRGSVPNSGPLSQFSGNIGRGASVPNSGPLSQFSGNLGRGASVPNSGPLSQFSGNIDRSASGANKALEGLRHINKRTGDDFDDVTWLAVSARFNQLASKVDDMLQRKDFAECIGFKDSEPFAEELLNALTRRKGVQFKEKISKKELQDYWRRITDKTFDARMELFFDLCDKDLDGSIFAEEVMEMILLSAAANKLSILPEQAKEYAALIMEELDRHHQGYIELSELEKLMRAPTVQKPGNDNFSQQLLQPRPRQRSRWQHYSRMYRLYLQDYWIRVWLFMSWAGFVLGLFSWKFSQYRHREAFEVMGYCVCVAKGAAETLKLNLALILLPVCRNTITYLRSTCLGTVVPFDDNIKFHKLVAGGIAVGVIIHGGVHLACDFPRLLSHLDHPYAQYLAVEHFNGQIPTYWMIIATPVVTTGLIMVVLMGTAYLFASYWLRKSVFKLPRPFHRLTGFNAFWYSHHLFIIVYILLVVHGYYLLLTNDWSQKSTWMYISVPLCLYCGERILRTFRATTYRVNTLEANIYPGDVLAIQMSKPPTFKYQSGMYLFLQCPSISPFEWHPFSITSAPGDDHISVHIRGLGDWTKALHKTFKEAICTAQNEDFSINSKYPKLCIDGPYGAPAQDFRKYDVLLLVGLGIGATPFISILKNMLNDIKNADALSSPDNNPSGSPLDVCKSIDSPRSLWDLASPSRKSLDSPMRQRKRRPRVTTNAYFYWVTREQGSFEWFKGVMNEVAAMDQKAVIEMHNYLTSIYEEGDARSALITMVQALHHAKSGVDIVSGTRARTHFARPNWDEVFQRLAKTHPKAKIGVFYCGLPALGKELDSLSRKYSQFSNARFEFHNENF